jgi:N-acetylglutamate synthase-like GNAT family acetyltransferase
MAKSALNRLPQGVLVRRARPGDSAQVLALVEQLGYSPEERGYDETFAQVVRHPEAAVFVATEGPRVIGYLALSQRPQIRLGGRAAVIDELVVEDSRRGEGIGSALLAAALAQASGVGCRRVEVTSRRTRESYQRGFYLAHGFREVDSAVLRLDPLPPPVRKP